VDRTTRRPLSPDEAKARLRAADPARRLGAATLVLHDAARRRPWRLLAAAVGVGFALGASRGARSGALSALSAWVRGRGGR
jgi:hypothetical protein